MAREQYIFETNTINGGFLVDRRTNQIVGTTANGVDQYFVTGDRNPVTGGIESLSAVGRNPVADIGQSGGNLAYRQARKRDRILSRCMTGRSNAVALSNVLFPANSNINGMTLHYRLGLAADFDSVRIIIPNMHTSAVAGVTCAVGVSAALGAWSGAAPIANNTGAATAAAPTNTESVNTSGGVFLTAKFQGASSATLPIATDATNLVPSWTQTDWLPIKSLARSDSGAFPLLDVRLYWPAGSTATVAYTGASNSAWAMWGRDDVVTGGRVYRVWAMDAEAIATPANFTAATTSAFHTPIIIQYRSKVTGKTVSVLGDSIYDAHNVTYTNNGFAWQSILEKSTATAPIELCNLCAPGLNTLKMVERAQALMQLIQPAVIVAQSNSLNNYGTSLGARVQQHGEGTAGSMLGISYDCGSALVLGSMFPVTNVAKAWGATDSQRVTINTNLGARTDDYVWLNWGPTVDGVVTNGQVEPIAGLIQGDGIHFNDAGHTAMITPFSAALTSAGV